MLEINKWYTDDLNRTILLTNITESLTGERFPFEGLVMKFHTSLKQIETWNMELLKERTLTPIPAEKATKLQSQFNARRNCD